MKFHWLCVLLVSFIDAEKSLFASSPWGWSCESVNGEDRCVKNLQSEQNELLTLATCKLTCGLYGALWPKPSSSTLAKSVNYFLPSNILNQIFASPSITVLLNQAIDIFKTNVEKYHLEYNNDSSIWDGIHSPEVSNHILQIVITVDSDEEQLKLSTDESYILTLNSGLNQSNATISATTFYGARHALETLSQLIDYDERKNSLQILSSANVQDTPAHPYRGILLDTSRNFFPVDTIKKVLDAMSYDKLNSFHWHLTDTHSFPLYLTSLPNLSFYGAYSHRQIYTPDDVRDIVAYAKVRGIRVVPEFDAPAHVGHGWQYGNLQGLGNLVVCLNKEPWQSYCVEPPCGQFNLANGNIYVALESLYNELFSLFSPLEMFHFGGDEVNLNCWNTTQEIVDWLMAQGEDLSENSYYKQWNIFQEKAFNLTKAANGGNNIIGLLWTSSLTNPSIIEQYLNKNDYTIQIWTKINDPVITSILEKGYKVIFSNYDALYFDCGFGAWVGEGNNWCSPYIGWQKVYENDINITNYKDQILGGEVTMWSEQVDPSSLETKVWPRASAAAESLWSSPPGNWETAEYRMVHNRQRLVSRGIQADRLQPEWCHQNEGLCYITNQS